MKNEDAERILKEAVSQGYTTGTGKNVVFKLMPIDYDLPETMAKGLMHLQWDQMTIANRLAGLDEDYIQIGVDLHKIVKKNRKIEKLFKEMFGEETSCIGVAFKIKTVNNGVVETKYIDARSKPIVGGLEWKTEFDLVLNFLFLKTLLIAKKRIKHGEYQERPASNTEIAVVLCRFYSLLREYSPDAPPRWFSPKGDGDNPASLLVRVNTLMKNRNAQQVVSEYAEQLGFSNAYCNFIDKHINNQKHKPRMDKKPNS